MVFWRNKRFWMAAAIGVIGSGLAAAAVGYGYIRQLDVSSLDHPLPSPTLVLDRYGKPASQLSSSKMEPLPLARMPVSLIDAVVAVEDRRFFEHTGLDVRGIMRALVKDISSGGYSEGASTITQQLAKNMFLSSDKSLSRKLKEAAYAVKIEQTYSKDDILETYLNSIYFGEGSWGVQGAAKTYFGKNVQELSLPECALLAALPKAPSRYSPMKSEKDALDRRNTVLALMKEQGKISVSEYEQAKAAPLGTKPERQSDGLKGRYPAYVDQVIQEATERYGFTENQLLTGGLKITTELDPKVQDAVLDVYGNDGLFPESKPDQRIQSGAVILDQRTGGIRALAGGRGEGVFRGFSRATQLKRQPGSSFKPIMVYGPALELGYTPGSLLYDGPLNLGGYQPEDWDHQVRGQVSMEEAIIRSWNIPAVWLLNQLGIDHGLQFAAKLGIPLPKEDRQLGSALGGLTQGVSPLQMAQAFSAFAAGGTLHQAHAIVKIETGDGHVLVEAKSQPQPVMKPVSAAYMTSMLQAAVQQGTGRNAGMNRPVAGKSGTTQLPDTKEFAGLDANAANDAWFVGYTPELTAAIWVGYDKTDRDHYLLTSGGAVPAVLFREIMGRALEGVPVVPFDLSAVPAAKVRTDGSAMQAPAGQQQSAQARQIPETAQQDNGGNGNGHGKGKKK